MQAPNAVPEEIQLFAIRPLRVLEISRFIILQQMNAFLYYATGMPLLSGLILSQ